jgi:methanogenic corrinoid protein MtbC1
MNTEIAEELGNAITTYNRAEAERCAREWVQKKMNPLEALDVMTEAIRKVGDGFGRGELWLPELVGAAAAMEAATPVIEEDIKRAGAKRKSLGTIVIGTVFGDIHTIGKTMVATLLTAGGFHVVDLGINVTADRFIEGIQKYQADILAMSALMTTTAPEQRKVIEALKKKGLRNKVKIMVGGGSITKEFANTIGADGYDPTAPGAVMLAAKLLKA